jgi:hypothetical protein
MIEFYFRKARAKGQGETDGMSNAGILSSVLKMLASLTFIKDERAQSIKIYGEYTDQTFDSNAIEIIRLHEIPAAIDQLLKRAEQHLAEKPVRALFMLLKAEYIINVAVHYQSSLRHLTTRETTSNTWS